MCIRDRCMCVPSRVSCRYIRQGRKLSVLSCWMLCVASFPPFWCALGASCRFRLLGALFVCFCSVLLVRACGPALCLGLCLLGFPTVACAITHVPIIASPFKCSGANATPERGERAPSSMICGLSSVVGMHRLAGVSSECVSWSFPARVSDCLCMPITKRRNG